MRDTYNMPLFLSSSYLIQINFTLKIIIIIIMIIMIIIIITEI